MSRTLIIAEKPSVAADIAKVVGAKDKQTSTFEGDGCLVSWAVGHLLEFVPPEGYDESLKRWRLKDLPILPDEFQIAPVRGTTKQLNALKRLLGRKDVDRVVNACDAGREGELIFREIMRWAGCEKPVDRLWLQSMTPDAIRASLEAPRAQDEVQGLADAADCRAESDWLVGMNATRALTVRLRSARDRIVWSAGRVQTATLALLVRREREILAHEPRPYWLVRGTFAVGGDSGHEYAGVWFDPKGEKPRDRIFDPAVRDRVLACLKEASRGEATETRKDRREVAPPLFDLTSLQREANRRFGLSARRTLASAQALYERHKLITYPRTDSRALPSDYRDHVAGALGFLASLEAYESHAQRLLDSELSNAKRNFNDDAVSDHFAIVPTGQGKPNGLKNDDARLFDLIARRFLAAFHPPAISTEVERITRVGEEQFQTRGRHLKIAGWRTVWGKEADDPSVAALPPLPDAPDVGVEVRGGEAEEKETRPPARLTEAGVLSLMETAGRVVDDSHLAKVLKETGGLGTPAPRAEIIETLLTREYASRCSTMDKRKALRATPRGIRLIEALERIELPRLTSAEMTAELEDALREVEAERLSRSEYMDDLRKWTSEIVDRVRAFKFDELYSDTEDLGECPVCGAGVRESLRAYGCVHSGRDGECSFVIWKETGGRFIDRRSALQLMANGETPAKPGFFTRSGREYEASLHLTEDKRVEVRSRHHGEVMAASGVSAEPADIGPCPFHPELTVRRSPAGYRCDAYAKKECKLSLPLEVCQRALKIEEVEQLIGAERHTDVLEGFISRRNRPFSATLHLTDEGRLRWEFPPRGSKASDDAAGKEFPVNPEPVAKCPNHPDKDVVETPTAYVCGEDGCSATLPREVCQREVTRDEAAAYFSEKETPVLDGFISRKGSTFAASLYMKRTGRHGFRFGPRGG